MSDIAIQVEGLVKEYEVYAKPIDLAVEVLTRRKRHKVFRALDGVSFQVTRGEVLGIIGSNGAGKSTLLKVITGVLEPTYGKVDISGRVTAILELGLGFNPEYSGRENIYLSGLLYGMDREEIDRKIEEIIDFSGLSEFIERPVKTYSSGMHSRLAFSIATAVEPDILIIDEALAAGDSAFVQKCMRRIRNLCSGGRTVLLVSHGTGLLAQLCQRVIWMEHGQVRMIGPAINVVQAYDLTAHQQADSASWIEVVDDQLDAAPADEAAAGSKGGDVERSTPAESMSLKEISATIGDGERHIFRRGPVLIDSVEMLDSDGALTTRLTLLKPFKLRIRYHVEGDIPDVSLGVALAVNGRYDLAAYMQFFTQNIRPFETRESYLEAPDRFLPTRSGVVVLDFDYVPFRKGEYFLSIGLVPNTPGTWEFYEYRHFYYTFSVEDAGMEVGAPIFFNARLTHLADTNAPDNVAEGNETAPAGTPAPEQPNLHDTGDVARAKKAAMSEAEESFGGGGSSPGVTTLRGEIEAICFGEGGYPDQWPRHEHCPACARGDLSPIFSKYGFTHARCADCGFVCVDPFPPEHVLRKLYSGAYYTKTRELFELPLLKKGGAGTPFSAPPEVLRSIVTKATAERKPGTWLDVGGGLGAFANLIQQMRPDWKVTLNELNARSVEIATSLFDLDAVADDPKTLLAAGEQFDVVSSVAVLEHIPEPYEFLASYAQLVRPGGWLVTAVPHFSDLNATLSQGSSANVVPPFHVSLFNEEGLSRLMSRVPGLELSSIEQAGPAAFDLIHHPDTGDYWDITIPSDSDPAPRSILLQPYEHEKAVTLNELQKAAPSLSEFFAKHDGRQYLIAFCRRR